LSYQKENAGGYFLIIAAFDSTKVTITPAGFTAGGHKPKIPYTVLLRRGQCYWVKGTGEDPKNDLSASIVSSSKPVAVLAGHEDAFLGTTEGATVDGRNFMIQQMIPAEYFASSGYVSIPRYDPRGFTSADSGYGENFR